MRAQHEAEVEPLHWSHRELKKTAALCPSARPRPRPERSSLWVSVFRACGAARGGGGLKCPKMTGSSKPLTCLETNRSVVFHQIS